MGADLSRVRTDPLRDHSGVNLQQGRLLLDSDFNEQVDIVDRRLRAAVADAASAGVPRVSKVTPDAFKISASGGALSIGRGRMYVDGLLAENHGDPAKPVFDPVLAEPTFDGPLDYLAQPYWPSPDPLPKTGGPHLVYLDVWQRELTPLQAPDLVEPAVGVDTTTRTQTVWQVRLLENVGTGTTCGSGIADWDELTAPSAARLSTGTVPVDADDDPCELPPTGGYRGLEHHLYRVELHDDSSFKWSRDNASVASTVEELVSPTELRLARVRRDDLLRFAEDDWVEITDDRRELNRLPGEMRRISVDDATNTITFSPALPADLVPSGTGDDTVAGRHTRVILWNQRGRVLDANGAVVVDLDVAASTGVVPIPAAGTRVVLEHGITVEFTGGAGRTGDYWVFAARTGIASIEELDAAPPRGIHHHYARLSLVTFPGAATDCRPDDTPPPTTVEGCPCEVCVTPESHASGELTIQDAINRVVEAGGGTVSLCPGDYPLREPLVVHNAKSVILRGHGAHSRLIAEGPALLLHTVQDVVVERLGIAASGGPGVVAYNGMLVKLEELTVVVATRDAGGPAGIGIALAGVQLAGLVRRCLVEADIAIGTINLDTPTRGVAELPGAARALYSVGLRIEDNVLQGRRRGVDLTGTCVHGGELRIATNMVAVSAEVGIAATGLLMRGEGTFVDGVLTVNGNVVRTAGGVGIMTSGRAVVVDNEIASRERGIDEHGILVAAEPPGAEPGHVQIIGNRIIGVGGYGIAVEAPVASLLVKQNVIQGAGGGITVRGQGRKEHVSIDNNHVIDVLLPDRGDEPTVTIRPGASLGTPTGALARGIVQGIAVTGAGATQVVGNQVSGVGADGTASAAIGIAVMLGDDVRVNDNTVLRVGSPNQDGAAIGVGVASTARSVTIGDNTVHSGEDGAPKHRPGFRALVVTGAGRAGGPTRVVRTREYGSVAFDGAWLYTKAAADGPGAPLQLLGNTLFGGGELPAATLAADGHALLSTNRVVQPPDLEPAAVELTAPVAVVQGNSASGGRPTMRLDVSPDASVIIGNVTTGDIVVGGTPVRSTGKAWSQLNPVVP